MILPIKIETSKKDEVIDITRVIEKELSELALDSGICNVFAQHTTCAVTTADLDPGTDKDLLNALRNLLPEIKYNHPHDPSHTPDHILSSIIGPSVTVPFESGKLKLGTWQRVILVELDGPRTRNITLTF
jgi:secondary thiamine-phosphate synthase enzyme